MKSNPIGFQTITWGFGNKELQEAWKDISELGFRYFEVLNVSSLVDDFERRTLQLGAVGPAQRLTDTDYLSWVGLLTEAKRVYGLQVTSIYTDAEFINPNIWDMELAPEWSGSSSPDLRRRSSRSRWRPQPSGLRGNGAIP